jgi:folate-binding protein YgfZ
MFTVSIQQQHQSVHEEVGLFDFSHYGKIELAGTDARSFLHRLTTQDIQTLPAPQLRYALLLDNKGKILADMTVWALDDRFLILTAPLLKERIQQYLQKYLITEEVTIHDRTADFSLFSLQGPLASSFLQELNRVVPPGIFVGQEVTWKDPSYFLLIPRTVFDSFFSLLYRQGKSAGLQTIEPIVQEILRVENGIPQYGKDFSEENTPPETRLFRAISYTKGCYPGQEIVARLKTYGGYRKQLVGLRLEQGTVSPPKAADCLQIFDQQKQIGHITSITYSPKWNGTIAIGYVQRDDAVEGKKVTVTCDDNQLEATIIELTALPLKDPPPSPSPFKGEGRGGGNSRET